MINQYMFHAEKYSWTPLVVGALLLSACSPTHNMKPQVWHHPDYGETYVTDNLDFKQARDDCEEAHFHPLEIDGEVVSGAGDLRRAWIGYYLETLKVIKNDLKNEAYGYWGGVSSVAKKYGLTDTASLPNSNTFNEAANEIFQLMDHPEEYEAISAMMNTQGPCLAEKGWTPVPGKAPWD